MGFPLFLYIQHQSIAFHKKEGACLGWDGFLTRKHLPQNGLPPSAFSLKEWPKSLKLVSTGMGFGGPNHNASESQDPTHTIWVDMTHPSGMGFGKPIGLNWEDWASTVSNRVERGFSGLVGSNTTPTSPSWPILFRSNTIQALLNLY